MRTSRRGGAVVGVVGLLALGLVQLVGVGTAGATVGTPTTLTAAASSAAIGSPVSDGAALSGGDNPTGHITFEAWGPSDQADCSGNPVFTTTVTVTGNGNYSSGNFTPSTPGSYWWTATYGGDPGNDPSFTTCGAPAQSSTISRAQPTLTATATPGSGPVGSALSLTAGLSGAFNPTGSITASLFGPSDPTCGGTPLHTETFTVTDNGSHTTGTTTASTPGLYQWHVSYTGDTRNEARDLPCGTSGMLTMVSATPQPTTIVADPIYLRLSPFRLSNGNVSAVLTSAGQPVVGQRVYFTAAFDRPVCSALTNSAGRATCRPDLVGAYLLQTFGRVRATFRGTTDFAPSTDTAGWIE